MPRNSSGTYALPAGNPVVTNTLIQSTWANTTLSDVSTAMTDSLDRNGRGAMLAPLKNVDGTAVAPAFTFSSEGSLGIYRAAAGVLGFAVGGALVLSLTSTGLTFTTPLVVPIGSATAPSIAFVTNTNTGIYSPATNQVAITTNGSQKLLVDASGNITIAGTLGVGGTSIGFSGAGANTISAGNATGFLQFQTGGANTRLTIDAAGAATFSGATTFSSAATFSANAIFNGNVGIGAAPSAWGSNGNLQLSAASVGIVLSGGGSYMSNAYYNAGYKYVGTGFALRHDQNVGAGQHQWHTAPSGTAGNAATFVQIMALDSSGNLGLGNAPIATVRIAMNDGTITTLLGYNYSANTVSGIGTNTAHALGFLTSGAERMRISSVGAVGIGGTPTTFVDVFVAGGMLRVGGGSGNNLIQAYSSGGTLGMWAGGASQIYSNGALSFLVGATTGTAFPSGGTTAISIDSSGNVGIGKAPSLRLDVTTAASIMAGFDSTNAGAGYVQFSNSGTTYGYVGSGLPLVTGGLATDYALRAVTNILFATGATERMRIDSGGSVAINAANPNNRELMIGGRAVTELVLKSTVASGGAGSSTIYFGNSATDGVGYINYDHSANSLAFNVNSGTRLTISSAGVISDATAELGWKDLPVNSQAGPYTLVIGDRAKIVYCGATGVTVPASVFSQGQVITIYNNSAGSQTITQGASVTLYFGATGGTGNRTLGPRGIATVVCLAANTFVITGAGLS